MIGAGKEKRMVCLKRIENLKGTDWTLRMFGMRGGHQTNGGDADEL